MTEDRNRPLPVARHRTAGGRTIYRLPLEVFPGLYGNAYLIDGGERPILVDCGSGQASSNRDLERGRELVAERFGRRIAWRDLGAIVITHGHIDHFGGLHHLRRESTAPIAVHVLDRRVLSCWEERLVVASKQVEIFLAGSGLSDERRAQYMAMYLSMKGLFRSLPAEVGFEEGPISDGDLEAIHVPGHCPGQVCLRLDDVLFTADHVLPKISPNVAPESITPWTGLGHYLLSLKQVAELPGIALGLGGHGGPIADVAGRAGEIRRHHDKRLAQIHQFCAEPRTIVELSRAVYGRVKSYHVLLALLETGAHVEHLYQRGGLCVVNLDEVESERDPVMRYQRI
ncbi:MAG: MBL fold metallo-hydrolase [Acidobacteria bacterium]|nr:MAG: MBL fold metallo-hydrolase [Acidobacteriota bacterium]